jgi:hypothetical protein
VLCDGEPPNTKFGSRDGKAEDNDHMSPAEKIAMASALITALTAIFTGIAALAAWRSVRTARRTAEAATCLRLFERYESDRMLWALRALRTSKPQDIDVTQWAKGVDLARREVTGTFFWLARLYEGGLIMPSLIRTAGYIAGINLFYDVCEPLERALNPADYPERRFRLLEKVVGRYGKERQASQTHLTPSAKAATFYRKQAEKQEVSSCPPRSHSYFQQ